MGERAKEIPSRYIPGESEKEIYEFWEEKGYFMPSGRPGAGTYCIVIPPPNITGSLHMGHALNNSIQDCLARVERMRGKEVLWMPGVDHAGIATQNVVDRWVSSGGAGREELGRDGFVEKIWEWKKIYGEDIVSQLRLLGSSCDWTRLRFTMDERYSTAVIEAFVRLYDEGLIYRGSRLINWCTDCRTAISDIEVEYEESEGKFYYIRYPSGSDDGITVATTRPETMLGDTAVAVNPGDKRYSKYIGRNVTLPLKNRSIPVIADERVDMSFGTGAVKITPAHDASDFEIGADHKLDPVKVIGEDGRMTSEAGEFAGQDRFECRKNVLGRLQKQGLLVKTEPRLHSVGRCYRCESVIEPLISMQWFLGMKQLAPPAAEAVRKGRVRFIPEKWSGVYLNWMDNIKDWCISRQIWWGHRLPVWYCRMCDYVNVERSKPGACRGCGSAELYREQDVLDTWFSSALWPFAGLGWPEEDAGDLKKFYPTQTLVTGHEIIYFWVARMIMLGIRFMGEEPFGEVYIHGIVRDEKGKKMSKSMGNVVDPREIIAQYGTDALRLTLLMNLGGQDIRLGGDKLEGMRNFANKLWNAGRFILMNAEESSASFEIADYDSLPLDDRWILSEMQNLKASVSENIKGYRFSEACQEIYEFAWHRFCDWYLELVKPRLADNSDGEGVVNVLLAVWKDLISLLHPFAPFITERLWRYLPEKIKSGKSIMTASWPVFDERLCEQSSVELAMRKFDIITAGRRLRTEQGLGPGRKAEFVIVPSDRSELELFSSGIDGMMSLLNASKISIAASKPGGSPAAVTDSGSGIYIILEESDRKRNLKKLKDELETVEKDIKRCEKKLANDSFIEKAPENIVHKEKKRKEELAQKKEKILLHVNEMEAREQAA